MTAPPFPKVKRSLKTKLAKSQDAFYGRIPRHSLEEYMASLALLSDDDILQQKVVADRARKMYLKSRPGASPASVVVPRR